MDAYEVFLRGAWTCIPDEEDVSWVGRIAASEASSAPLGDYGPLVKKMLDAGLTEKEIARFARIVGYEAVFGVLYLLSDPTPAYEGFEEQDREEEDDDEGAEEGQFVWNLYLVDPETDELTEPLDCLHEGLLSSDPTGREMRPPE